MTRRSKLLIAVTFLIPALFIQCSEDNNGTGETTGTFALKITDAPSDDANIQGIFVTVSDVKIDGQSVEGFSKQTIEISAYQQGDARLLINEAMEAETYSSVSLVLNYQTDESGESPGCYVLTSDNAKHNLAAESQSQSEMTFLNDFEIHSDTESSWVVDLDLRKAVAREEDSSTEREYKFVTSAEMQGAFRIVEEENSGEVHGNVSGTLITGDNMYVYAYKKGDFNASTETQEQGSSNVLFANAVTSAKVQSDGSYTLAFLQEGDYEIHVASYEEQSNGKSEFSALLNANSQISGLLLNDVSVSSETTVELDIEILGLI